MPEKHTPGPWQVGKADHVEIKMAGMLIGKPDCEISNSDSVVAFIVFFHKHTKANARLICAAPELLAACRATAASIVQQMRYHRHVQESIPKHLEESLGIANSAIAKAEGRETGRPAQPPCPGPSCEQYGTTHVHEWRR